MDLFEVELSEVHFFAYHGVYDFERVKGNDFVVNIKVKYPAPSAELIREDCLSNSISYVDLFEIAKEEMETPRNLLETVCEAIVSRIRTAFPQCCEIHCSLTKCHPPIPDFNGRATVTLSYISPNEPK